MDYRKVSLMVTEGLKENSQAGKYPLTVFALCSRCDPCSPKRDPVHDGEPDGGAAGFVEWVNVAQTAFLFDHPRSLRGLAHVHRAMELGASGSPSAC
jgi:hypothetical protein